MSACVGQNAKDSHIRRRYRMKYGLEIVIACIGAGFLMWIFKTLVRVHVLSIIVLLAGAAINFLFGFGMVINPSTESPAGWSLLMPLLFVAFALLARAWNGVWMMSRRIPYRIVRTTSSIFMGFSAVPFLSIFLWITSSEPAMGDCPGWIVKTLLWLLSFGLLAGAAESTAVMKKIEAKLKELAYVNYQGLVNYVIDEKILAKKDDDDDKKEQLELLRFIVDREVKEGTLVSVDLGGEEYLFQIGIWKRIKDDVCEIVGDADRVPAEFFYTALRKLISIGEEALDELLAELDAPVSKYEFEDGMFFIRAENSHNVRICSSCGLARWFSDDEEVPQGEYFCSALCEDTDRHCHEIAIGSLGEKMVDFAHKAAALGVIVQGNSYFWGRNLKMMSPNARGPHGFAAEDANTYIDRAHFRNAQVVGDNNAKNGADRLVDGVLIQTKYCASGRESVNAGFGQDGMYKYMDANNKPMQLEVPKDQYFDALQQMEKKIAEGKVPGVADPSEAKNIIRQGNVTYDQAVAITKFGTVESLMFDASRGVVVGLAAGGISFAISTALTYWRTKDLDLAIRSSLVLGLKTGGLTMFSFVASQQLQRIPQVNAFLDSAINVNFGAHGKFVKRIGDGLYKMGGGQGKYGKKANATVKSAVVVAAVTFAITSSWEMIKLARGRISGWQCWKNIVQGAGGITGGTIGALIGGALLSPVPVVGTLVGSLIGGTIGGVAGAAGTKAVMDQFGEDDSAMIIRIISHQVEFLTRQYCLNEDEINEVNDRIDGELKNHSGIIEDIYEHEGCRRQYVNSILQPIFVEVIGSRGIINVDSMQEESIVKAITQEMAA